MTEQTQEFDITQAIAEYSTAFDILCQERHEAGAREYGAFTFVGNDVIRMMMEELADTSNYCRMQFIKLMMLQHILEAQREGLGDVTEGNITIGLGSFKGVGETGWVEDRG